MILIICAIMIVLLALSVLVAVAVNVRVERATKRSEFTARLSSGSPYHYADHEGGPWVDIMPRGGP
jgi:flagellar basal body-associated protein FliL